MSTMVESPLIPPSNASAPPKVVLKWATPNQVQVACKRYHYAHSVPAAQVSFACFEDGLFVGVIIFGGGANNNLAKKYGVKQGQIMELVRVALNNEHKAPTSQYVAIAIRLLRKVKPLVQLLISYADTKQGHKGIIYQATNWLYMGQSFAESAIDPETGKVTHTRPLHSKYGSIKGFTRVKDMPKHIYIYPFTKAMRQELESRALPYQGKGAGAIPSLSHQV